MNIKDLIAEVRAHDASANPGPWRTQICVESDLIDTHSSIKGNGYLLVDDAEHADAALIANYRTAAPLLADEVERLNAVNEEHRLTLAAEQGKPEGAASDRWRVSYNRHGFEWWRGEDDELPEVECHLSGGEWRWTKPGFESNPYPTARACMLAADKDGT